MSENIVGIPPESEAPPPFQRSSPPLAFRGTVLLSGFNDIVVIGLGYHAQHEKLRPYTRHMTLNRGNQYDVRPLVLINLHNQPEIHTSPSNHEQACLLQQQAGGISRPEWIRSWSWIADGRKYPLYKKIRIFFLTWSTTTYSISSISLAKKQLYPVWVDPKRAVESWEVIRDE